MGYAITSLTGNRPSCKDLFKVFNVAGIAAAGCGQFQSRATVGDSVPRGGADLQAHQHRGCEPAGNRFERSGPPRPVLPFPVSFPLSLHQAPPPASPPEKVARERGAGENRKGFPRVGAPAEAGAVGCSDLVLAVGGGPGGALYLSWTDNCCARNNCAGRVSAFDACDYGVPVDESSEQEQGGLGDWELHRLQEKFEARAGKARLWRASRLGFGLPRAVKDPRVLGAPDFQVEKAEAMMERGLVAKARRQALCGVLGMEQDCTNTACGFRGYRRFRCKNRYCPECGPRAFRELMGRYSRLAEVVERLVPGWQGDPHYKRRADVVAKLDVTTRNLGRMPTNEEVRLFNRLVRLWMRLVERKLGLPKGSWGFAWCDEFGGRNTNLHAHGVYAGPWLPQAKLSAWWREVCAGTVFEGSFIISIKRARSFSQALAHALKYPAKYVSCSDPERLADLELAFHRVRRVHSMGAFYGVKLDARVEGGGPACPLCGSALRAVDRWRLVRELEAEGRMDIEACRQRVGRERVFRGPP